jgi:hypothetical protein
LGSANVGASVPAVIATLHHVRTKPCHTGGLMRCCINTLDTTPVLEIEGETLQCKYTDDPLHNMISKAARGNGITTFSSSNPSAKI